MLESLAKYSQDFHLYIFAFDDRSCDLLRRLKLANVTIISLEEFEDENLLRIKPQRTLGEYCWTCTPAIIKYSIEKFKLPSCTYLDADLYFFDDPAILLKELGEKSVSITDHRYTPEYDQGETSGKYCVQFMTFKNDQLGMTVLNWWRDACIEWCFNRFEDGKFGDQKYLDDWMQRFKGVHEIAHLGAGIAPWNVQQYQFYNLEQKLYGKINQTQSRVVFYHFHNFKFFENDYCELGHYKLTNQTIELIYRPYVQHLDLIKQKIENLGDQFDYHGTAKKVVGLKPFLRGIKRRLNNNYNIFPLKYFRK